MIARIWRGETRAEVADPYAAYLDRTGAADCRKTPGNRGVRVLPPSRGFSPRDRPA